MSRKETIELEWFSVEEKLPDYNCSILMLTQDEEVLVGEVTYGKHFVADNYRKDDISVIEWCYYPF